MAREVAPSAFVNGGPNACLSRRRFELVVIIVPLGARETLRSLGGVVTFSVPSVSRAPWYIPRARESLEYIQSHVVPAAQVVATAGAGATSLGRSDPSLLALRWPRKYI